MQAEIESCTENSPKTQRPICTGRRPRKPSSVRPATQWTAAAKDRAEGGSLQDLLLRERSVVVAPLASVCRGTSARRLGTNAS